VPQCGAVPAAKLQHNIIIGNNRQQQQSTMTIPQDVLTPINIEVTSGGVDSTELLELGSSQQQDDADSQHRQASIIVEDPLPRNYSHLLEIHESDSEAVRKWKSSPWAVGLARATWQEELSKADDDNLSSSGHLRISGLVCGSCLKMERLGHMSILWKTSPKDDTKPQIRLMAGPFWFVTVFVTIPVIVAISLFIFLRYIHGCFPIYVSVLWGVSLALCLLSLVRASTMDPGIPHRYHESPHEGWIWNDQAKSYRSPTAKYVTSCAVVVEGYDHVCPWVGTAIGANNMRWFRRFVWMVGICLITDVVLILLVFQGGVITMTETCAGLV
jgi:DHHC palmitoyltransferase